MGLLRETIDNSGLRLKCTACQRYFRKDVRALTSKTIATLMLLFACLRPAVGMQPCPYNESELFANAKTVVEARVRSLSIGDFGIVSAEEKTSASTVKVDLEIKRVIKGDFTGKEATIYGIAYDLALGPLKSLAVMAAVYGLDEAVSFEVELSRQELDDSGLAAFSLRSCGSYWKFPHLLE
ncbi:hypothetical protein [Rhizobium sp. PL01]|uniref:hypothetical protein n=1 Tax=Rhizobium sp. PL01 TaxID=3085631 RepID=UPI00298142A6|nr:hypothetical protein [Rhizobium sp. PL01]MDW5314304.1 hypothetical protein [Rhizobium sp. PL01]